MCLLELSSSKLVAFSSVIIIHKGSTVADTSAVINNVGVYLFIYKQLRRMQEMVAQMQAQMAAQQKGGMPNGGGPHAV